MLEASMPPPSKHATASQGTPYMSCKNSNDTMHQAHLSAVLWSSTMGHLLAERCAGDNPPVRQTCR
eukprot:3896392-Pyramimonas_sp.AAC.1